MTQSIGDFFGPQKDHVLLWFPVAAVSGGFMIMLIVDIFMGRPVALHTSGLVFLSAPKAVKSVCVGDAADNHELVRFFTRGGEGERAPGKRSW